MKYPCWIGAILLLSSSILWAEQPLVLPATPLPAQTAQSFDWHNLSSGPACPIIGGKPNCNVCTDMSASPTVSCSSSAFCCGRASFANAQVNDRCIELPSGSSAISDCCTQNGQDPGSTVISYCTGGLVCDYSHPDLVACVAPSSVNKVSS